MPEDSLPSLTTLFHAVRSTRTARPEDVGASRERAAQRLARVEASLPAPHDDGDRRAAGLVTIDRRDGHAHRHG